VGHHSLPLLSEHQHQEQLATGPDSLPGIITSNDISNLPTIVTLLIHLRALTPGSAGGAAAVWLEAARTPSA